MTEFTLLTAMGEVEDELLERSSRPHRKRNWMALALSAACLCLVTVLALQGGWLHIGSDSAADNAVQEMQPVDNAGSVTADTEAKDKSTALHVVELGEAPAVVQSDIGLFTEDYIGMSEEQLTHYYGASLIPGWVPEDLTYGGTLYGGIYVRPEDAAKNGAPYYDQNTLTYADVTEWSWQHGKYATKADWETAVAHGRSLCVTAAAAGEIFYDVVIGPEETARENGKMSAVNSVEVLAYHYTFQNAGYYGARFDKGGTHFEVTGKNLTLDEFTRVLESLI